MLSCREPSTRYGWWQSTRSTGSLSRGAPREDSPRPPNRPLSRDPPAAPLSNTREVVPLRCARRTTAPPLLHHPAMYPLPARVRVETLLGLWCSSPCPGYFSLPCLARSSQRLSGAHPSQPPASFHAGFPVEWRSPVEVPSGGPFCGHPLHPTVHPSLPLQCAHPQSPAFL